MKKHQALGFCPGCYNSVFHLEKVKLYNARREYGIGSELYKKIIEKCVICGFDKAVDLHHLDHNHKNNSENNLIGLCPNHHKLIHTKKYQKEVFSALKEKGYKVPEEGYEMDGFVTKGRRLSETTLLSEKSLAKTWLTKEEDKTWKDL